jgi:hypothetical protein
MILTFLRFVRSVWIEARQMQAAEIRRNPHLRDWD